MVTGMEADVVEDGIDKVKVVVLPLFSACVEPEPEPLAFINVVKHSTSKPASVIFFALHTNLRLACG